MSLRNCRFPFVHSDNLPKMVNIYPYVTIYVCGTVHQVMNTYLFMRTVHLPVQLLFMCTALLTNTVLLHYQGTPGPYLHVKDQGSFKSDLLLTNTVPERLLALISLSSLRIFKS
ncbi:hypothetical protein ACE6H2_013262 [Prunus campanulata]